MRSYEKYTNILLIFIIFFTSFFTGYIFSLYVQENRDFDLLKEKQDVFLDAVLAPENDLDLTPFWEAYSIVREEYYDATDVEKKDLVRGMISGMVDSLKDKHSEYMTPVQKKKFEEVLEGDFEGIGAIVEKVSIGVKIERVLKGSPAKKYGVLPGDIVLEAGGEKLEDLDLYDAVEKIKGPAGSTARLKILRAGETDFLEIDVVREKINIPSVDSKDIDDTIGYIAINMFGTTTSSEFSNELEKMKDKQGIIIDLRDNGGGYLNSAVQIVSNFLPAGERIVTTKYKNIFKNIRYESVNFGDIYGQKIVVLINGNSASASEITAGALRDHDKAIIVGEQSYGKGSVQQPFDLSDGSLLKLTIAKWFTPDDKNIDHEGISPDVVVHFEKEDYDAQYDRQLEVAKEVLGKFIEVGNLERVVEVFSSEASGSGEVVEK